MTRCNQTLGLSPVQWGQCPSEASLWSRTILFVTCTSFLLVVFGCATSGPSQPTSTMAPTATLSKSAVSGTLQQLDYFVSVNPDCTSAGYPTVRVVTAPGHGTLTFEQGTVYPNFAKDNQRYECNKQRLPAMLVSYQSSPGYAGPDTATVEAIFPTTGFLRTTTYILTVK